MYCHMGFKTAILRTVAVVGGEPNSSADKPTSNASRSRVCGSEDVEIIDLRLVAKEGPPTLADD